MEYLKRLFIQYNTRDIKWENFEKECFDVVTNVIDKQLELAPETDRSIIERELPKYKALFDNEADDINNGSVLNWNIEAQLKWPQPECYNLFPVKSREEIEEIEGDIVFPLTFRLMGSTCIDSQPSDYPPCLVPTMQNLKLIRTYQEKYGLDVEADNECLFASDEPQGEEYPKPIPVYTVYSTNFDPFSVDVFDVVAMLRCKYVRDRYFVCSYYELDYSPPGLIADSLLTRDNYLVDFKFWKAREYIMDNNKDNSYDAKQMLSQMTVPWSLAAYYYIISLGPEKSWDMFNYFELAALMYIKEDWSFTQLLNDLSIDDIWLNFEKKIKILCATDNGSDLDKMYQILLAKWIFVVKKN